MTITKKTKRAKDLFAHFAARLGIRAFTMAEVIIAASIFIFISGAVYGIGSSGKRAWDIGEALLKTQQQARVSLMQIERELRLAYHVTLSDSEDTSAISFSIPIDRDGNGFVDLWPGTSVVVYGADDPSDFDGDNEFWEAYWKIEYQIDKVNNRIIRRVLDDTTQRSIRVITSNINSDSTLTFFQDETGAVEGGTDEAIIVSLTIEKATIAGRAIDPPLRTTLLTRVKLRN